MYDSIFLFGCVLVMGLVAWRSLSIVLRISDHSLRRKEYERKDHLQMIERLLEKRDAGSSKIDVIQLHAQERNNKNRMDAEVEKNAVVIPGVSKEAKVPQDVFSTETGS